MERPRYEYRVWGNNLAELRDRLERLGIGSPARLSRETYLISARTDDCNLKIRAERLIMKELIATENGLELWKPILDNRFPLDRSIITDQIFPSLELKSPELGRPFYSIDDFLNEVIRAEPTIVIVSIIKRRARFRLDQSLAEFTSVTIDKRALDTVAVESVNPDAVFRLVRKLGIAGIPNTSYIRQLKEILSNDNSIDMEDRAQSQAR